MCCLFIYLCWWLSRWLYADPTLALNVHPAMLQPRVAASTHGDHEQKKRALMEGLCGLIDADFWIWGLAADYHPDKPVMYTAMTTGGFSEEQVPKLLLALDNRNL